MSLEPWKFQTKWSFTSGNSTKLCYSHWNVQGQKPRPMEVPHYFFLDHAWKSHFFFLLISAVSRFYFFNPPGNSMSSKPPFAFFWNSTLEVVTASQICKPLIQQSTRFGQRAQIILFKLSFWFYVSPDSPPIMNLQAIA